MFGVCHKCKGQFEMGYTGIVDRRDRPTCDACAGIVRTPEGYALSPDEQQRGYRMQDLETGEVTVYAPLPESERREVRR